MYLDIETALKNCIDEISTLTGNVTQGDYRILDTGVDRAVIVYPGTFTLPAETGMAVRATWELGIQLFVRYSDEGNTHTEFINLREAVLAKILREFPNTANPLTSVKGYGIINISAENQPQDVTLNGQPKGVPVFRSQIFIMQVEEFVIINDNLKEVYR